MNVVLLLAHSIEEHDQVRLLSGLGYNVFSIGGYIDPAHPHDPKRPALPDAPFFPELKSAVDELGTPDNLDAAKRHIPDAILDWADVLIYHHYEHTWLVPEWNRIRHKRVIWRTVGQSIEGNERAMKPLRDQGLQIVRYSPKERNIPGYAGEDALIRFYKDPDEWCGWTGDIPTIVNVTQHLYQRSLDDEGKLKPAGEQWTNYSFWKEATKGLPELAIGPGSEAIGGTGPVSLAKMQELLRRGRAYLYTGTQPASYTLGLIEALMTGIPVVSIGPGWMRIFPYGPDLFEGHEIVSESPDPVVRLDDPAEARKDLRFYLDHPNQTASLLGRNRAIELFGMETIGAQWKAFLG